MQCNACKSMLQEDAKFCYACGTKYEENQPSWDNTEIDYSAFEEEYLESKERVVRHADTNRLDEIFDSAKRKDTRIILFPKNKYGATVHNLNLYSSEYSSATVQGKDVYLVDERSIYRIRESEVTLVSDHRNHEFIPLTQLNVVGEYLYFTNREEIYRVQTDGHSLEKIFDISKYGDNGSIKFMIVIDDWIYFTAIIDEILPCIFRISINGHNRKVI